MSDLGFILRTDLNPELGIYDADYIAAAEELGVEVAAIQAIVEVESPRGAFDLAGRPTILFERHYFHRLTGGRYNRYKDLSDGAAGGYGKFSEQYPKFQRAYALDADAAVRSASWGRFQIMGENYQAVGFESATEFVLSLLPSERAHLDAFVAFIKYHPRMRKALADKDWAEFARRYNGPGYKRNAYDEKLAGAYETFSLV